jgi:Protein of unknown function (DUF2723)
MRAPATPANLSRIDALLAVGLAALFLAAYTRTLAPDILYSDSGEFQTLAFTLGTTHSTGYPVYLLLARTIGLPTFNTFAWRVSFASALCAATTLGLVFMCVRLLLARSPTSAGAGRIAAALAAGALGLATNFWSQAIIAEVYTPSAMFVAAVMLLLIFWHGAPQQRSGALFAAGVLLGLSFGVHAGSALVGPPAVAFVALVALRHRAVRWRTITAGTLGLALGLAAFMLAFLLIELNNPPSSFMRAAILPSRSAWNLSAADLDNVFERMWITFSGRQWHSVMFPGLANFLRALGVFLARLSWLEFSPLMPVLVLSGLVGAGRRHGSAGAFVSGTLAFVLFMVLNYQPGDQEVFFLPAYVLLAMLAGLGAARWRVKPARRSRVLMAVSGLIAAAAIVAPFASSRADALRSGKASFFSSRYVFEVDQPASARDYAYAQLKGLPPAALAVVQWRGMYALFYVAHVEGLRPDVAFVEATPFGTNRQLADSMVEYLSDALRAGRRVVADQQYPNAARYFTIRRIAGSNWYELSLAR